MTEYQAGACNIGQAERRKRYATGIAGFAAAIVLAVGVVVLNVEAHWLLAVAAPLFVGFLGLFQGREQFCVGFAMAGVYDVSDTGAQRREAPADARRADQRRAVLLQAKALLAAIAVTLALYAVA
jgi:hypothetical protein